MNPKPRDFERHITRNYNFSRVKKLINPRMLYNKHLGLKKDIDVLLKAGDRTAVILKEQVEAALNEANRSGLLKLDCVYKFFRAQSEHNYIHIFDGKTDARLAVLSFPRQSEGDKLCLSDFVSPADSGEKDYMAVFACTSGQAVLDRARDLRVQGEFLKSHLMNIVAMVCAEALAEAVHSDIRRHWGFPDPASMSPAEILRAAYRGKRFSLGYPACPDLEDQKILFRLIQPEEIGITIADGAMMSPETSVTALAFHNQAARYFSVLDDFL